MTRVMAPARRDFGQHLVSNVEICLRPGGVIERAPDKVEQIGQGFERIVELIRHGLDRKCGRAMWLLGHFAAEAILEPRPQLRDRLSPFRDPPPVLAQ
jgi:hypothetical protein